MKCPSIPVLIVGMIALCSPATADDAGPLYRSQAIVTGTGEANRQIGFRLCLERVLVRASGDPSILSEPGVTALMEEPGKLVAEFRYRDRMEGIPVHDEQGTHDRPHDLTCIYEPAALDPILASLGRKPWLGKRPTLTILLAVEDSRRRFVLARDGSESPYMVDSFEAAAAPMAMGIEIPPATALERAGIGFDQARSPTANQFAALARAGGDPALVGSIRWSDADLGWIAEWSLAVGGRTHRWSIRGVSFDDAFRNAVAGSAKILSGNGDP